MLVGKFQDSPFVKIAVVADSSRAILKDLKECRSSMDGHEIFPGSKINPGVVI